METTEIRSPHERALARAVQAAREYYSASETVLSELGTGNTTQDDLMRQAMASGDLHDALVELDATPTP